MSTLTPTSPCSATVTPDDKGGIDVAVFIPTYSGGATLHITAERDNDGDWRVFIPWPDDFPGDQTSSVNDGLGDAGGGILYLGAPDGEVKRKKGRA